MALPVIAMAAASAIPSIANWFGGRKQIKQAEEIAANNTLSPYTTPQEILAGTSLAEQNYLNGMPGSNQAINNINRNASGAYGTATQAATSSGDLLDSISKIGSGVNDATNQLAAQEAQYKAGALGNYIGALGTQAGYRDKEYQMNEYEPYIRKANTAAALYGAGKTNQASALDGLTTAAMAGMSAFNGRGNMPTMGEALGQQNLSPLGYVRPTLNTSMLIPSSQFYKLGN